MGRPRRGEVWLIDLGYAAKVRPGFVLSHAPSDADRALVTIIPHTTSPRGSNFEVPLETAFLHPGVFDAQNPTTTSLAKLIRKLGDLSTGQTRQIEDAVRAWLGL